MWWLLSNHLNWKISVCLTDLAPHRLVHYGLTLVRYSLLYDWNSLQHGHCLSKTLGKTLHGWPVSADSLMYTVYPKKYAHGFVVLCFVVVMQSFIMNSHEVFIHIHQGCFAGTGAIVRFPQCQWSKPDGYGKISQCITTTKHSKAKTVCIFLGIYCILHLLSSCSFNIVSWHIAL